MRRIVVTLLAVCMCTNIPAPSPAADSAASFTADFAASFADGAAAYDGGRYADAFSAWHALAIAGDVRAQIAVAGMHRSGEGRPIDFGEAARWYRRAAEARDPIAQLNYAELLETGRGLRRDPNAAWDWYDRAARQGNAWAAARRARLGDRLGNRHGTRNTD
jgi:hypothetical protein